MQKHTYRSHPELVFPVDGCCKQEGTMATQSRKRQEQSRLFLGSSCRRRAGKDDEQQQLFLQPLPERMEAAGRRPRPSQTHTYAGTPPARRSATAAATACAVSLCGKNGRVACDLHRVRDNVTARSA
uniref:Uncharacterized protein n=1 Tax=Oryza sativa subsp. japonica TaxID=39947 RepID=Q6K7I0_ORYSJ|nr:hypothetical protein [Oryza sativa Japonica Group]